MDTYLYPVVSAERDLFREVDVHRVSLGVFDQELVCVRDRGSLVSSQLAACVVNSLHWLAGDTQGLVHS